MRVRAWISGLLVTEFLGAGLSAQPQQAKDEDLSKGTKAIVVIGRLKDFGTRNWRPSIYIDEIELARSQNGRYLVAKVDPGKRIVRAEDPKYSLQMDVKAGECHFFRVEIASGGIKAHGRLVGLSLEEGASELKQLTPIDSSYVKDTSRVLGPEQAAAAAEACVAGQTDNNPPTTSP